MNKLILCFLLACSSVPVSFQRINFTPDEDKELEAAAARWNFLIKQEHRIDFNNGKWKVIKGQTPHNISNGETQSGERTVWIRPKDGVTVYQIALHEFGHALGLGHVSKGVMNPFAIDVEFSTEDVAECKSKGICK